LGDVFGYVFVRKEGAEEGFELFETVFEGLDVGFGWSAFLGTKERHEHRRWWRHMDVDGGVQTGETYLGSLDVGTFYPVGHTIRAFMIGHIVSVACCRPGESSHRHSTR
jgi:hypothetical protein